MIILTKPLLMLIYHNCMFLWKDPPFYIPEKYDFINLEMNFYLRDELITTLTGKLLF